MKKEHFQKLITEEYQVRYIQQADSAEGFSFALDGIEISSKKK